LYQTLAIFEMITGFRKAAYPRSAHMLKHLRKIAIVAHRRVNRCAIVPEGHHIGFQEKRTWNSGRLYRRSTSSSSARLSQLPPDSYRAPMN
jgi:hypothetical protein